MAGSVPLPFEDNSLAAVHLGVQYSNANLMCMADWRVLIFRAKAPRRGSVDGSWARNRLAQADVTRRTNYSNFVAVNVVLVIFTRYLLGQEPL